MKTLQNIGYTFLLILMTIILSLTLCGSYLWLWIAVKLKSSFLNRNILKMLTDMTKLLVSNNDKP